MFIKQMHTIYALYIIANPPSARLKKAIHRAETLYFRTEAEAQHYQKMHYQKVNTEIRAISAIEDNGQFKHFHFRPSASKHRFGAYILDDHLRKFILEQDGWVLVGFKSTVPESTYCRFAGLI